MFSARSVNRRFLESEDTSESCLSRATYPLNNTSYPEILLYRNWAIRSRLVEWRESFESLHVIFRFCQIQTARIRNIKTNRQIKIMIANERNRNNQLPFGMKFTSKSFRHKYLRNERDLDMHSIVIPLTDDQQLSQGSPIAENPRTH